MSPVIAVASGKGGTGKTTVAASLVAALAEDGASVSFLDCDVEAPNAHIYLKPNLDKRQDVVIPIPQVDEMRCNGCGRCAEVCEYHAILVLKGKPLVFPQLCHGCGSCTLECPQAAIVEVPRKIGVLEGGSARLGVNFTHGILDIGEPMAVPVIRQLKKLASHNWAAAVIRDAPPGASCPVVEVLRGADFALLVTEPTPFGLHDLALVAQLTGELGIPTGVVINRDGIGDDQVQAYCQERGLPLLMRIPLEKEIGAGIAEGKLLVDIHPEYRQRFWQAFRQIEALLESGKRAA